MRLSIAASLGVRPEQIVHLSVDEGDAGDADCEDDDDDDDDEDSGSSAAQALLRRMRVAARRMSVKVKEHITYEVIVPPEMDDSVFVERNKELVTPGSAVQQYMKKELKHKGIRVQTKSLKVEKAPYLEYVPGVAIVGRFEWWSLFLLGALVLVGCLGAIAFCVIRASVSAETASERGAPASSRQPSLRLRGGLPGPGGYHEPSGESPRAELPQSEAQGLTPPAPLRVPTLQETPQLRPVRTLRDAQGLTPPKPLRVASLHETPRLLSPQREAQRLTPALLRVPNLQLGPRQPAQQSLPVPQLQPPGVRGTQSQLQAPTPTVNSFGNPPPTPSSIEIPPRILQDLLSDDFGGA